MGKQSELTARVTGAGVGDDFESQALQRVPSKQCDGLAESDMAGRLAAAEHVVVHARQVVVHKRVSVDEFNRRRRRVDVRGVRVHQFAARISEECVPVYRRREPRASPCKTAGVSEGIGKSTQNTRDSCALTGPDREGDISSSRSSASTRSGANALSTLFSRTRTCRRVPARSDSTEQLGAAQGRQGIR